MKIKLFEKKSDLGLASITACCQEFIGNINRLFVISIEIDRSHNKMDEIIHKASVIFNDDFLIHTKVPESPIVCCPFCRAEINIKWERTSPLSE